MKVKLIAIGGKKAGMEIPITTPTFLIGRDEKCHLRPECKFVNHVHCQISVDKGSVVVDDCSGAIGTFVNGEKVKWRHVLKNGDRIKVGTLELEVRFTANEKDEKKPIPKAREVAGSAVVAAAINGQEAEILKWVEGKSEKPKEAKQNATLAANLAATSVNKTPGVALVVPPFKVASQDRPVQAKWKSNTKGPICCGSHHRNHVDRRLVHGLAHDTVAALALASRALVLDTGGLVLEQLVVVPVDHVGDLFGIVDPATRNSHMAATGETITWTAEEEPSSDPTRSSGF